MKGFIKISFLTLILFSLTAFATTSSEDAATEFKRYTDSAVITHMGLCLNKMDLVSVYEGHGFKKMAILTILNENLDGGTFYAVIQKTFSNKFFVMTREKGVETVRELEELAWLKEVNSVNKAFVHFLNAPNSEDRECFLIPLGKM